jgi:chitinase
MTHTIKHFLTQFFFIILLIGLSTAAKKVVSQIPNPVLIGYFHNWQDANAPYIQLDQVDARYKIIDVAFAIPQAGTDYKMQFVPDQVSIPTFIAQIQTLHAQGRKVIISIGGATAPITLNSILERDTFVNTITSIINTYDFDGIDIDFEGSSLLVSGGTISNPTDQPIIHLINAIKQIMSNYQVIHNKKMILTMAPETAFVQGGQSAYGGIWGAYLPVIHALSDSMDILHVQLYNSGSMYGIDNNINQQGTSDFIVAMCEAVIQGFNTAGGYFNGVPAHKVAAGLPACPSAAGGGYCHPDTVKAAVNYLRGAGPAPGSYLLANASGYPSFRGLMTWSINWDAEPSCSNAYEFADNYTAIYGLPLPATLTDFSVEKNPDCSADIFWKTANELNSAYYEIQKSTDGINFLTINKVNSHNSSSPYEYHYTDNRSSADIEYYRLNMVDNDKNNRYSDTKKIVHCDIHKINIFPNPVYDHIYIQGTTRHDLIRITNTIGQVIYYNRANDNYVSINIEALPHNTYFISVYNEQTGQKTVHRIIKR